jgi:hypothetical protein
MVGAAAEEKNINHSGHKVSYIKERKRKFYDRPAVSVNLTAVKLLTHLTQSFGKQKRIYHEHHEQSRNS